MGQKHTDEMTDIEFFNYVGRLTADDLDSISDDNLGQMALRMERIAFDAINRRLGHDIRESGQLVDKMLECAIDKMDLMTTWDFITDVEDK